MPIKEIIIVMWNYLRSKFCNMTGYSLNELQTYGGSDEAFHIKNKFNHQMKMFIVEITIYI